MNTASSGSGRINDRQGRPQGAFRGQTKHVKITEDVRKYAAEQGIGEEQALKSGMEQKARDFTEAGAEVYAKA